MSDDGALELSRKYFWDVPHMRNNETKGGGPERIETALVLFNL